MTQFGRANAPASFGRKPVGGKPVSRSQLSPQAQAFLSGGKGQSGHQNGPLGFLADTELPSVNNERFGEKPVARIRFVAYLIDYLLIGVPFILIGLPIFTSELAAANALQDSDASLAQIYYVILKWIGMYACLKMIYAVAMESSSLQATVGKMLCGIVVTNKEMRKPTLGAVILRNTFGRVIFNCLPFSIAQIMMTFHPQKQGIHDMLAGTLVCKRGPAPTGHYAGVFS